MPLKITNGDTSSKFKVNISTTSCLPIFRITYDQSYFSNKTLGQYSTLYREFSSENLTIIILLIKYLAILKRLTHYAV